MSKDELLEKLAMERDKFLESIIDPSQHMPVGWTLAYGPKGIVYLELTSGAVSSIDEDEWLQRRAELINEPDDSKSPKWANWKAQMPSGEWWWSSDKPTRDQSGWGKPSINTTIATFAQSGKIPNGHDWTKTLTEIKTMTTTAHEDQYAPDREIPNSSVVETYAPHKWTIFEGAPTGDVSDPDEDAAWEERKAQLDKERGEQVKEWRGPEDGLPKPGHFCEVHYSGKWRECEIVANFKQRAGMVAAFTIEMNDGLKILDAFRVDRFRTIRTDRERWIEAAKKECIIEISDRQLGKFYDAGLACLPGANHETP